MDSFKSLLERRSVPVYPNNHWVKLAEYVSDHKLVFVQMATVNKFGLNPTNKFDTPTGIYCYPIIGEYKAALIHKHMQPEFPYGEKYRYMNVFIPKSSAKILWLGDYTDRDLEKDVKILGEKYKHFRNEIGFYIRLHDHPVSFAVWKKKLLARAKVKTAGGVLWYITMTLSKFIGGKSQSQSEHQWSNIFVDLGYDIAIDNKAETIIHEYEPLQAVVFSGIKKVQLLETIDTRSEIERVYYTHLENINKLADVLPKNSMVQIDSYTVIRPNKSVDEHEIEHLLNQGKTIPFEEIQLLTRWLDNGKIEPLDKTEPLSIKIHTSSSFIFIYDALFTNFSLSKSSKRLHIGLKTSMFKNSVLDFANIHGSQVALSFESIFFEGSLIENFFDMRSTKATNFFVDKCIMKNCKMPAANIRNSELITCSISNSDLENNKCKDLAANNVMWKNGTFDGGMWTGGIWKGGKWLGGENSVGKYHGPGDSPDKWDKK